MAHSGCHHLVGARVGLLIQPVKGAKPLWTDSQYSAIGFIVTCIAFGQALLPKVSKTKQNNVRLNFSTAPKGQRLVSWSLHLCLARRTGTEKEACLLLKADPLSVCLLTRPYKALCIYFAKSLLILPTERWHHSTPGGPVNQHAISSHTTCSIFSLLTQPVVFWFRRALS